MARRLFIVLLLLAFSAVALPAQASISRTRIQGGFAIAVWENGETGTFAVAEYFEDVDYLILILETVNRDAQGNVTGYTSFAADANGKPYGSFTIDQVNLGSASLAVSGVPASRCEYDANGEFIECTDATMDANVTWTGYGSLNRENYSLHESFHQGGMGYVLNVTSTGTNRSADAAGSINGTTLTTYDLTRGTLAFSRRGSVSINFCAHTHDC